ncbi:MAG: carboxypeptidase-like regulatory domain-containing protein [Longimicrobiales bacterium]|nr:carboxypeptidase-like regulatory domain-containing protein [Longimicrobiales bacterium]
MRRGVSIALLLPALSGIPISAQVVVEVREAGTGRPVPDARLEFVDAPEIETGFGFALTDASGRATFREVEAGEWTLEATARGYEVRELRVEVLPDAPTFVRVEMTATPIALDPLAVNVEGLDPLLLHHGFYERRASNRGYYYDPERIERIAARMRLTAMLRYMRPVRDSIRRDGTHVPWIKRGSGCSPTIYLDGTRLTGVDVDNLVNPNDVIGVEIYDRADLVPIAFRTGEGPDCAILVWTRRN